jgi:hypothetical protein
MATKRRGRGQFSPYTSHVIVGRGQIRIVNLDTFSAPAEIYISQLVIHAPDRVYNSFYQLNIVMTQLFLRK